MFLKNNSAQKECFIGIADDGTKTSLRAVTRFGKVLCSFSGGSTNICSNTKAQVRTNLEDLWSRVISDNPDIQPLSVCLGTTGSAKTEAIPFLAKALSDITGAEIVRVMGDMEVLLEANASGEDALVLISDAGSACYGKSRDGAEALAGGYGHHFSDEGSGYWISKEAFSAVFKSYDGRGDSTLLTGIILEKTGCSSPMEIIDYAYADFDKSRIADIASSVDEAANEGDEAALQILGRAADELFELCNTVARRLGYGRRSFKVLLSGSVLLRSGLVAEKLTELIRKSYITAQIAPTAQDAATDAVVIARRAAKG